MPNPRRAPVSAESTGGIGEEYQQNVGAACLALLLTGGMSFLLPDAELVQVSFQTERLGWETDDLLLIGSTRTGQERRLALQVKRALFWRPSDVECRETVVRAWRDFQTPSRFNAEYDRIGIIIGQTNQKLSKGLRSAIELARATVDAQSFMDRTVTQGHVSEDARDALATLRTITDSINGSTVEDELIWRFLRILDFVILDFDTPSSSAKVLVKSLLAGTSSFPNGDASDSWDTLYRIAGEASPAGRDIRWLDLPEELRNRHPKASGAVRSQLSTLETLTNLVRTGIDTSIRGIASLSRRDIVSTILDAIPENQAVVVTGEAGRGKSVVARHVFDAVKVGVFALAFRAETFAEPHIATSFSRVGANLPEILRLFALHPQKLLWIESAERLLEKDAAQRAAFDDLLRLFMATSGWKLLITCREYSVETFRSTFLERSGCKSCVVTVPLLTDGELEEVQRQIPELVIPLSQPTLRKLARNPFLLDLQARMTWNALAPVPASLRAFRMQAWRQLIRKDEEAVQGMPLERERAMIEIALRRARALHPFINVDGVSASALQALQRDSLIAADPSDPGKFAPAHDVYEDWCLLLWLGRLYEQLQALDPGFFGRVETHPAMRRAFRRWLTELFEQDAEEGSRLLAQVLNGADIAQHWKDDALVSMLQCSECTALLLRTSAQVFSGNANLLRRTIHLLRVACRSSPPGLPEELALSQSILIPNGAAWDSLPPMVAANLAIFGPTDIILLLRFLEESIVRRDRSADCDRALADVAQHLFEWLQYIRPQYRSATEKRILTVMLAVPRFLEARLRTMIEAALADWNGSRRNKPLLELIWNQFTGETMCREFPDVTLTIAELFLELIASSDDEEESVGHRLRHRTEVANVFGFDHATSLDGYPASAWQGPFHNLLTHHPPMGMDLIVRLVNRSCTFYGESQQTIIEEPISVELILNDGRRTAQWGNNRLWGSFRGITVMPHYIESALMALEEWLLGKAERGDVDTRDICSELLIASNNIAITAVVASVAMAYPDFIGEAALPLLTVPALYEWDKARWIQDQSHGYSALADIYPARDEKLIFEQERKLAAKRPHRSKDLEVLCIQLQLTSSRPTVWAILDQYSSELPPVRRQNEADRLWRIKLHRIDVRNFVATPVAGGIHWQAGPFAPDLEQVRRDFIPGHQDRETRIGLFMWGVCVFERRDPKKYPPEQWREKLTTVRSLPAESEDESSILYKNGSHQIAAVCLRDHWDDLTPEENAWCVEQILSEVERLQGMNHFMRISASVMDSIGPCTFIVPLIAAKNRDASDIPRLLRCLTIIITSGEEDISRWAGLGLGKYLFATNRDMTFSVLGGLFRYVQELADFNVRESALPWAERHDESAFTAELVQQISHAAQRAPAFEPSLLGQTAFNRYPYILALGPLLGVFGEQPEDPLSVIFFENIARLLAESWTSDSRRYSQSREENDHFNHQYNYRLYQNLAHFALAAEEADALRVISQLAAIAGDNPGEAGTFLECLILAEDRDFRTDRFWKVWKLYADAFQQSDVGSDLNEQNDKIEFLRRLLLNVNWNADTRVWRSLSGRGQLLTAFFEQIPTSFHANSAFVALISRFNSEFFPSAIPLLAGKIRGLEVPMSQLAMAKLEASLGNLVYSGSLEIRRNNVLRAATLSVLDTLIEAGSAVAFRIRDDFLTPLN